MVVSNIFYFHPYLGKIPILTNIFSDGLVQPPTSHAAAFISTTFVFFDKKVSDSLALSELYIYGCFQK